MPASQPKSNKRGMGNLSLYGLLMNKLNNGIFNDLTDKGDE